MMRLLVCFVIVCVSSTSNLAMESNEEEFNLEKELQSLNKPPVTTVEIEGGEIIDCIDFYQQPTFDHPLLKNHSVQMSPNASVDEEEQYRRKYRKGVNCPSGTVPMKRTTKQDLLKSKSVSNPHIPIRNPHIHHAVYVSTNHNTGNRIRGVRGIASVYSLKLRQRQRSQANIWLQAGPPEQINYITAGWMVSPYLYGDDNPHLYFYWSADNGQGTGCFNYNCRGFVQLHPHVRLGDVLLPVSRYGGPTYDFKVIIRQDKATLNWILSVFQKEEVIGYLPKEFVPYLKGGADMVAWGGAVYPEASEISPPMGSGVKPDWRFNHAAYFKFISYYDTKFNKKIPTYNETVHHVTCKHYGFQNMFTRPLRKHFLYGGPGGRCD